MRGSRDIAERLFVFALLYPGRNLSFSLAYSPSEIRRFTVPGELAWKLSWEEKPLAAFRAEVERLVGRRT